MIEKYVQKKKDSYTQYKMKKCRETAMEIAEERVQKEIERIAGDFQGNEYKNQNSPIKPQKPDKKSLPDTIVLKAPVDDTTLIDSTSE